MGPNVALTAESHSLLSLMTTAQVVEALVRVLVEGVGVFCGELHVGPWNVLILANFASCWNSLAWLSAQYS